jgi:hypothetical protein
MKRSLLGALLAMVAAVCGPVSGSLVEPAPLEWSQLLGGERGDFGNSIIELPEGGFTLVGETSSFGDRIDMIWSAIPRPLSPRAPAPGPEPRGTRMAVKMISLWRGTGRIAARRPGDASTIDAGPFNG